MPRIQNMPNSSRIVFSDNMVTTVSVDPSTTLYFLAYDSLHVSMNYHINFNVCGRIDNIGVSQELVPTIDPDLIVDIGL